MITQETEERGKNPIRSRDHNRKLILDLLRQYKQLGRKDMANMTSLSSPAIGNILESLLAEGLILEKERLRHGRGQPALQFSLNPQGAYTIGFEIGVNVITTIALDLAGNPIVQRRHALEKATLEVYLHLLQTEQKRIATQTTGKLLGIGVVIPGPFATDYHATSPTTLSFREKLDKTCLEKALCSDVWIENDANAAALAELLFGKAVGLRDFAMIYFGAGLGLGIISHGRLLRGSFGNAGELGHIPIVTHGLSCSCGQYGCLERYVSRHALSERLQQSLSPGSVQKLWEQQSPELLCWIKESGLYLAPILHLIESLLDPQSIIIGGQLPTAVVKALIAAIPLRNSVVNYPTRQHPRLMCGDTGAFTAALGAAALPLYNIFTP